MNSDLKRPNTYVSCFGVSGHQGVPSIPRIIDKGGKELKHFVGFKGVVVSLSDTGKRERELRNNLSFSWDELYRSSCPPPVPATAPPQAEPQSTEKSTRC